MDNRKFKDVVKTIREAEKDIDTLLKAAKLARYERQRQYMDPESKMFVICIALMVVMFLGFVWITKK